MTADPPTPWHDPEPEPTAEERRAFADRHIAEVRGSLIDRLLADWNSGIPMVIRELPALDARATWTYERLLAESKTMRGAAITGYDPARR